MLKRTNNISEQQLAFGGTLFVHLAGIFVMLLYSISIDKKEFRGSVELSWGAGTNTSSSQFQRHQQNGSSSASRFKKKENTSRIKLPTRVLKDRTKLPLNVKQRKKEEVEPLERKRINELHRSNISRVEDFLKNSKNNFYGNNEFISDNSFDAVEYSIAWSGGALRRKVYGNLPSYPEGVNVKAQVKIQAVILPDGTVGKCIPLLTTDRRLVNAALSEVRTWKFAPLKKRYRQANQKCVVTFNFRLE
jgi:hypothetical protein